MGLMFIFLVNISLIAQNDRYQLFVVHEDHVNEDMKDKHHEADKAIVKAVKDHKMTNMDWITFVGDDNRVMYLSPIKSMAELDKNPFQELGKKMGEDAMEELFSKYDGTYSKHGDYILRLDNDLSYMPDGMTTTPENEDYRVLTFYEIPPGKEDKAEELARSVKKMYSEMGSKLHYRLYKSGFGNMGNYYMVAVAAKSPEDMERKNKENMDLIGDKGKAMFDEIENNFSEKEVTGYIRRELSYVNN